MCGMPPVDFGPFRLYLPVTALVNALEDTSGDDGTLPARR